MITKHNFGWALAALALSASACSEDPGTGRVAFTTWGEEYIEQEIPADELADGWRVTFDKFLVVLRDVTVADLDGNLGARMEGAVLVDHKAPGVKPVVTFEGLEARPWERVSFAIAPADGDVALEGATEADRELMLGAGAAVHVEARAGKGGVEKRMRWTFAAPTAYRACRGDKDGKETEGVLVTNGGTDAVELTVHGDHLFYDDLQAQNAVLRFDAIASADANADDEITLEELSAVKLVDIPEGSYGTGSAGDINDLGAFVAALARTLGHFRGEGECVSGDP